MTDRKGLKKIVRARMERTGESYSSSLRQVRRPATLPPGLVAGYRSFGAQRHHPSALTRHLLGQLPVGLSEPVVCGLGGGIGFLYAVFTYAQLPHPLLTIVAQHHPQPWAPAVARRLGVPFAEQHSGTPAAAMTKLRRALDAGRAVLCTVDRSGLPWHRDTSPLTYADPYPVVVAGAHGELLWLDDTAATPHRIEADRFVRAWSAHRKGRHHMLTLDHPPPHLDVPAAARAALATTVAHLTGPVLGNSYDVNFGFSGMAKLASELREPRAKTGWARRFATPEAFQHAMRRLDACLQREYTAPEATRAIYADFLDEVAPLLGEASLAEAASLFRDSGAGWSAVCATARAALATGWPAPGRRREIFDELAERVTSNLDIETAAARLLAAASRG